MKTEAMARAVIITKVQWATVLMRAETIVRVAKIMKVREAMVLMAMNMEGGDMVPVKIRAKEEVILRVVMNTQVPKNTDLEVMNTKEMWALKNIQGPKMVKSVRGDLVETKETLAKKNREWVDGAIKINQMMISATAAEKIEIMMKPL